MQALDNLRAAVASKPRGATRQAKQIVWRHHVEVSPADVVAVCDAIPAASRDQKVQDLRMGSAAILHDPGVAEVVLHADDVFHLLDLADQAAAAATPSPAAVQAPAPDPALPH